MSTLEEVSEKPTGDTYRTRAVAILNDACGSQELWGFHDVGIYGVVDTAASEIDSLQSRVAVLEEAVRHGLVCLEANERLKRPHWDGTAAPGSPLGLARTALTQSSGERREVET